MTVDVDAWALAQREKLADIFRRRGSLVTGAWALITLDPITRKELPEPETWFQVSTDYGSATDFLEALRVHSFRLGALGILLFGEGVHERSLLPMIGVSYARRGRIKATVWAAPILGELPGRELGAFEESSTENEFFPLTN